MTSDDRRAYRYLGGPRSKEERVGRSDRATVRYLWSLLYRAARRNAQRIDLALRSVTSLARRVGSLTTELETLKSRVDALERAVYPRRPRPGPRPQPQPTLEQPRWPESGDRP